MVYWITGRAFLKQGDPLWKAELKRQMLSKKAQGVTKSIKADRFSTGGIMKKRFLEIGKIVSTHGVRGEVKVLPWCDSAEFLTEFEELYFDEGKTPVHIENARVHKGMAILKLDGVETMDAANTYRGKVLYMDREDIELAPGTYFIQDLIGLAVVDADTGEEYGTLSDVTQTGANDVYHIRTPQGKEYLIPAIEQVIEKTDIAGGKLLIHPLEGLFE